MTNQPLSEKHWLSWSNIIKVVLIWLILQTIVDIITKKSIAVSVFSLFFYSAGVVSGIGLTYSKELRRFEKRKRILELIKTIKQAYEKL